VLEMLTVLPEEVVDTQNTDCRVSPAHRSQYSREV
jgi:transportin-3